MNPGREPEAEPPNPPKFAARFYDEFSGKQKLLSTFFTKRPLNGATPSAKSSVSTSSCMDNTPEPTLEDAKKALRSVMEHGEHLSPTAAFESTLEDARRASDDEQEANLAEEFGSAEQTEHSLSQPVFDAKSATGCVPLSRSQPSTRTSISKPASSGSQALRKTSSAMISKHKSKEKLVKGQQTLASFIKRPAIKSNEVTNEVTSSSMDIKKGSHDSPATETSDLVDLHTDPAHPDGRVESPLPRNEVEEMTSLAAEDFQPNFNTASTSAAWSSLLTPKTVPKCSVHGEPAKEWTVNKPGPNKGRKFWLCSRGVGAKGDPEARFVLLLRD